MARNPLGSNGTVAAFSWVYGAVVDAYPDARCYVCDSPSVDGAPSAPTLGGDIDGVVFQTTAGACVMIAAFPGNRCTVEASAAFGAGTTLATLADGRVRTKGAGEIGVLTALQASAGAGSIVWAKFTSGR